MRSLRTKLQRPLVCLGAYLHSPPLLLGHKADIIPGLFKMCVTDIAEKSSKLPHAVLRAAAKER